MKHGWHGRTAAASMAAARANGAARNGPVLAFAALLALGAMALVSHAVDAAEPTPQERAQLEKQLADARDRLDDAARDVAELTGKLHGGDPGQPAVIYRHGKGAPPPRGAMLGINIGGDANRSRTDGVEIMSVSPSGPAEAAGLRKGDVITAVDGKSLTKSGQGGAGRQLVAHLQTVEPGQVVKLDYLRDGRKQTASVTTVAAEPPMARMMRDFLPMLEGMEIPPEFEDFAGGPRRGFRALELVPVTPKLGQYFGTDKGLLVVRAPESTGSKLEEGDVILSIGGRTPENPRHAFRILGSYQPSETVKVELMRQRKRMTLDVQLPADAGGGPAFGPAAPRPVPPPPPPPPRGGTVSS